MKAVNWNRLEDDISLTFWKQNISQFWTEEEIAISSDKSVWFDLTKAEQKAYKHVLGGLTLLDTKQGGEGMPLIAYHTENLQAKAVMAFMGAMEEIHAKSYSSIFTTLATEDEIDEIFAWVDKNPHLTKKSKLISKYYQKLLKKKVSKKDLYMAMVASVFLESFLFYSGFFYPLFLAGQGKMTASGEIINLIIRDESIHGVFIGMKAQEIYNQLTPWQKRSVDKKTKKLLVTLYENEVQYAKELYDEIGLTEEVNKFIRYNANKALMNLGKETYFESESINPIVENGLKTDTKNHDFFSVKGNGYIKTLNVVQLSDDDFKFDDVV